jgi:hypothetical protein
MKNPWATGEVYDGIEVAIQDAPSRVSAIKTMSNDRLKQALVWPGTQSMVRAKILNELKRRSGVAAAAVEKFQ